MAARHDLVTDPYVRSALLLARRGQAYFARALVNLRDQDFGLPSLLPGWSRGQVAVHVGLNARGISRLVEWARTGIETPMYASPDERLREIELGATLPVEAIRNLSLHAAVHLDVEWRDLPEENWTRLVSTPQGRTVPVSETVWMRTREVWLHALDLRSGASVDDFPDELVDLLLGDLVRVWHRRGESPPALERSDRPAPLGSGRADFVVRGTGRDLVAWGTGRGSRGVVTTSGEPAPLAPTWL